MCSAILNVAKLLTMDQQTLFITVVTSLGQVRRLYAVLKLPVIVLYSFVALLSPGVFNTKSLHPAMKSVPFKGITPIRVCVVLLYVKGIRDNARR